MRTPLFALCLLVSACAEEEPSATFETTIASSSGTTSSPTQTAELEFPTREGTFMTQFDAIPVDECGTLSQGLTPAPWTLDWLDDDSFEMVEPAVVCDVTGMDLHCETDEQDVMLGDAVLSVTVERYGEIVDAQTVSMVLDQTIDCLGTDCASFGAQFPCQLTIDTTSHWQED